MERWKRICKKLLFPQWQLVLLSVPVAAALVSMLALETAMLAQFGGNDTARSRMVMTGCTGAGVCAIVLGIAVYMIVRSTKKLKQAEGRKESNYEKE